MKAVHGQEQSKRIAADHFLDYAHSYRAFELKSWDHNSTATLSWPNHCLLLFFLPGSVSATRAKGKYSLYCVNSLAISNREQLTGTQESQDHHKSMGSAFRYYWWAVQRLPRLTWKHIIVLLSYRHNCTFTHTIGKECHCWISVQRRTHF